MFTVTQVNIIISKLLNFARNKSQFKYNALPYNTR